MGGGRSERDLPEQYRPPEGAEDIFSEPTEEAGDSFSGSDEAAGGICVRPGEEAGDIFERTRRIFGSAALRRLRTSTVAVFGLGGVGSYLCEGLLRAGVGELVLVDGDRYAESNLNRQLYATYDTLGENKAEAAARRAASVNPDCRLTARPVYFTPENAGEFDFSRYSYVADAVDSVTAKVELAVRAGAAGVPIISAMGAGNRIDPTRLAAADIYSTSGCPLAKVMRRELRRRGVERLKVVYSDEEPLLTPDTGKPGRVAPGSCSFVPAVAGLIMAGEIVRDIAGEEISRYQRTLKEERR